MAGGMLACSKGDGKEPGNPGGPDEKYSSFYYYSYEAEDIVTAERLGVAAADFIPGAVYQYGDTLFVANVKDNHYSVELYSVRNKSHLGSLEQWDYNGAAQQFSGRVEAFAVSGGRLYVANIASCIDVFDVATLKFITRIGNKNWGENAVQLLHSHAIAVSGDYLVVRMKNRMQVYRERDITADVYQKLPYYCRSVNEGFDVNNGFYSYQMVADTDGSLLVTDFGQYGNKKIQVIDTALFAGKDNVAFVDAGKSLQLDFNPCGIALHENRILVSASNGTLRVYDRAKNAFIKSMSGVNQYNFTKPEKLYVCAERLWVSDPNAKKVVGVRIYRNEIREYLTVKGGNVVRAIDPKSGGPLWVDVETHEIVSGFAD